MAIDYGYYGYTPDLQSGAFNFGSGNYMAGATSTPQSFVDLATAGNLSGLSSALSGQFGANLALQPLSPYAGEIAQNAINFYQTDLPAYQQQQAAAQQQQQQQAAEQQAAQAAAQQQAELLAQQQAQQAIADTAATKELQLSELGLSDLPVIGKDFPLQAGAAAESQLGLAANVAALQEQQRLGQRKAALYGSALPGVQAESALNLAALQGKGAESMAGRAMQAEAMRQNAQTMGRINQRGAAMGRSPNEVSHMQNLAELDTGRQLSSIPLALQQGARNYFTGLAGMSTQPTPQTRIQTPGISMLGITAPLEQRENMFRSELNKQIGFGTGMSEAPYVG